VVSLLKYVSIIFALFLTGCANEVRRVEPDNLFWPQPPNPSRIKYVRSLYSEDDIGRTYTLRERLFGKAYVDFIVRPYSVFARNGKVYVTDLSLRAVFVFDFLTHNVLLLGRQSAFQIPSAIVVGNSGTMYVADAGNGKISVFGPDGSYIAAYSLESGKPAAMAIDESRGRLYVVDRLNHKIVVLLTDGTRLFEFGSLGQEDGKFNIPLGIAVEPDGSIAVLDSGNFRVQRFTGEGAFLSKFGTVGDRPGMFANPKGIAVDSEDHIYVTDAAYNNFQIFDTQGQVLLYVGSLGPLPGQFHLPGGIFIDANDRIFVADQLNKRIEEFQYLKVK
jgi:DNA-binding beta-propeller fold protein YncE